MALRGERLPGLTADEQPIPVVGSEPERARRMRAGFLEAFKRQPDRAREGHYRFVGRPVRLRVVGEALAERTMRAFAHLRCTDAPRGSQLTIDLWDDESERRVAELSGVEHDEVARHWVACGGRLAASPDGCYVSFRYRSSITLLDRQAGQIIGCRCDGEHLSGGDYSKPLLMMLSIWCHDLGVQLLHTGLVAHAGLGVLIPGESGTGKSTTCLAGLAQGLEFLGDDFVGLERAAGGGFVGHSLFSTACLHSENLGRFPELRQHAVTGSPVVDEKPILFLSELFGNRIRARTPVAAIMLISIGHERTEVRPAKRSHALRAFAASTLHTVVPRPGRDALQIIGELAKTVPVWKLLLGPDLLDVRPAVEHIIARSPQPDAIAP